MTSLNWTGAYSKRREWWYRALSLKAPPQEKFCITSFGNHILRSLQTFLLRYASCSRGSCLAGKHILPDRPQRLIFANARELVMNCDSLPQVSRLQRSRINDVGILWCATEITKPSFSPLIPAHQSQSFTFSIGCQPPLPEEEYCEFKFWLL